MCILYYLLAVWHFREVEKVTNQTALKLTLFMNQKMRPPGYASRSLSDQFPHLTSQRWLGFEEFFGQ